MQSALKKNPHDTNIDLVFLLYWGVLVLWQNVNPGSTGSLADTLIKTGLILFLVAYYLLHTSTFSAKAFAFVVIFGLNMAISYLNEDSVTLRNILTYFFPVVFAFLSCCTGARFQINRKKLLRFMRILIFVVLYMTVYALLATPEKFLRALTTSTAYGNELSSFLVSNLEYGMYLMAGIVACIVCIELGEKKNIWKILFYGGSAVFFFCNLILTYSRTSILATSLIIFSYGLLNRKRRIGKILVLSILLLVGLIFCIPPLQTFFGEIVFKGNNLAGRDELASLASETFKNGSFSQKLWGRGDTAMSGFFREEVNHASIHNAYLQILLYFGGIPLIIMLLFLCCRLRENVKSLVKSRVLGVLFIGLTLACALTMVSSTVCLFSSPIDSFFVTMFTILVPKYVGNALSNGEFDS